MLFLLLKTFAYNITLYVLKAFCGVAGGRHLCRFKLPVTRTLKYPSVKIKNCIFFYYATNV